MSSSQKFVVAGFDITPLDEKLKKIEFLHKLSTQTGLPEVYLVGGVVGVVLSVLLLSFGLSAVIDLVGFATPVYLSFKSLSRDDQVGINQWLSYWTVYGFIIVAESFFFLSSLIPSYTLLKLAVLGFCMYDNGATRAYDVLIRPILQKFESIIDEGLENAKKAGSQVASAAASAVKNSVTGSN